MIKRIGIITNSEKKKSVETSREIIKFLRKHRIEVLETGNMGKAQLVVAIGGDGMVLRAARIIPPRIPVLPLHTGSLGFFSELNAAQFKKKFRQIVKGDFKIENRMMLCTKIGNSGFKALNDFVVERRAHRAIVLDVYVEKEKLANYLADGLIVATPTGSTAYSLAAGGPIVNPLLNALILVPISPHTLMNRSFVLSGSEAIKIIPDNDCFLTIDGQGKIPVHSGASIIIKKAPSAFKLVRTGERKFYSSVKTKLL